jgi:hypothetical protein
MTRQPLVGQGLLIIEASLSHSVIHTTSGNTPIAQEITALQRPLRDNKQHSQKTDTRAPSGIRTRNPSKRMAADSRLRPRGHWNRQ